MKKLIIFSLLLSMVAGFYSCLDDKNNFDYKQVNELDVLSDRAECEMNWTVQYLIWMSMDMKLP